MGIILENLEMYRYIGNKTKSYQTQKEFLLLFIFLSSRLWSLDWMPFDPIFLAVCLQIFCILSRTNLFTQASDPGSVLESKSQFAKFFIDAKDQLLLLQLRWTNIREPYLLRPTSYIHFYPHGGFKGLRLCINQKHFFAITQATNQSWGYL